MSDVPDLDHEASRLKMKGLSHEALREDALAANAYESAAILHEQEMETASLTEQQRLKIEISGLRRQASKLRGSPSIEPSLKRCRLHFDFERSLNGKRLEEYTRIVLVPRHFGEAWYFFSNGWPCRKIAFQCLTRKFTYPALNEALAHLEREMHETGQVAIYYRSEQQPVYCILWYAMLPLSFEELY